MNLVIAFDATEFFRTESALGVPLGVVFLVYLVIKAIEQNGNGTSRRDRPDRDHAERTARSWESWTSNMERLIAEERKAKQEILDRNHIGHTSPQFKEETPADSLEARHREYIDSVDWLEALVPQTEGEVPQQSPTAQQAASHAEAILTGREVPAEYAFSVLANLDRFGHSEAAGTLRNRMNMNIQKLIEDENLDSQSSSVAGSEGFAEGPESLPRG